MAEVNLRVDKAAASMVRKAVFDTPLSVAVIVPVTVAATAFVATVMATEAPPAGT